MTGDLTQPPSLQNSPDNRSSFPWRLLVALVLLAFGAIAGVLLIAFASTLDPIDVQFYTELRGILDEVRAVRASSTPDFTAARERAAKAKQDMVPVLREKASNKYPARQSMLWAVRDELPRMMAGDLLSESESERRFEVFLDEAAVSLKLKK